MAEGNNLDHDSLKGFVDRLLYVEQSFAEHKIEYADSKKDMKAEVKSRTEDTGVTFDQVAALVKIRMNEAEALDQQAETNAMAQLYAEVFGFSGATPEDDEEEDALG